MCISFRKRDLFASFSTFRAVPKFSSLIFLSHCKNRTISMFWYFSLFWGEIEPISLLKYCVCHFLCVCVTTADCYFTVCFMWNATRPLYYITIIYFSLNPICWKWYFSTPRPYVYIFFIWILSRYFLSNKRNGKLLDVSSQYIYPLLYIYQRNLFPPPRCIDNIQLKYIYCLRGLDLGFLLVLSLSASSSLFIYFGWIMNLDLKN